jgi:hypothetical protein
MRVDRLDRGPLGPRPSGEAGLSALLWRWVQRLRIPLASARVLWLAALLATAWTSGGSALAQEPGPGALEHWQRLPPERQAELRQRFEDFRKLEPEARAALVERARGLRERIERIDADFGPEERERLQGLPKDLRRRTLVDFLQARARFHFPDPNRLLPPDLERELARSSPGEGPKLFERARIHVHERAMKRTLERFGPRLGLSRERLEELRGLPPHERARKLRKHFDAWRGEDMPPRLREFLEQRQLGSESLWLGGPAAGRGLAPDERADPEGPLERPAPPYQPAIGRRILSALEPRLDDFLDAAEAGRRLSSEEVERLQRRRLLAAFPRLAEAPALLRRDLEHTPIRELLMRARISLDLPRGRAAAPSRAR